MNSILTFLYEILQSLLKLLTSGCIRRRGVQPAPLADIEEGLSSVDEKDDLLYEYDPAIERPVIVPVPDPRDDDFVEVSLSHTGDPQDVIPALPTPEATSQEQTAIDTPVKKPARARLLDILIQFPLPPSHKSARAGGVPLPSAPDPIVQSAWAPKILRLSSKRRNHDLGETIDLITNSVLPTPTPPTPTRRSSLVWFADKGCNGDETPTDIFWVPVQRAAADAPDDWKNGDRWISSEWTRDDMATVLKEFQEVDMHDEDFRELFANMSVSTEGYSFTSSSSDTTVGLLGLESSTLRWSLVGV